jgi:flagellar biosynthetic protein FliR
MPNSVKVLISLTFTILVFSTVKAELDIFELNYFEIFTKIISELLVGVSIGFLITVAYSAIQGAGRLIDLLSGFGFSAIIDPVNNSNATVTTNFYSIIATTLFFIIGGPGILINGIAQSYSVIPLGKFTINAAATQMLARSFSDIFLTALKIAAPIMAALFLTEIALAILTRAIPQLNFFVVGFPLKIAATLLLLGFTLINTVPYMQVLFNDSFMNMEYFLKVLKQ